jgi:copper resistance protein B
MNRLSLMTLAIALAIGTTPAWAQHQGHDMSSMPGMVMPKPAPAPAKKPAPKKPAPKPTAKPAPKPATKPAAKAAAPAKPVAKPVASMAGMDHSGMAGMDHAAMGHAMPAAPAKPAASKPKPAAKPNAKGTAKSPERATAPAAMDHSTMAMPAAPTTPAKANADMSGMDHSGMDMSGMDHSGMDHSGMDMSGKDMSGMDHGAMAMPGVQAPADLPANAAPRTPIPGVTAVDRAAAFPPVGPAHATHDRMAHSYWLLDRLEAREGGGGAWDGVAWIGGDINRVWLRSEGEVANGRVEHGSGEVLYGHAISPWWDLVGGVRVDAGEGPERAYAALGVQGLAPYKFEVQATGYIGTRGRTAARLEAEYDTLLTNRLILQWRSEAELYGRSDPARRIGAGLSTVEAGVRLRYEFTRRFAPYVGFEVDHAFGETGDFRRADGAPINDTRFVAGLRLWF